jgi:hypothetical protein
MADAEQARVEELEHLVSELRHDLRGAMSPAALIADRLRQSNDPAVQRSGKTIGIVVERVLGPNGAGDRPGRCPAMTRVS